MKTTSLFLVFCPALYSLVTAIPLKDDGSVSLIPSFLVPPPGPNRDVSLAPSVPVPPPRPINDVSLAPSVPVPPPRPRSRISFAPSASVPPRGPDIGVSLTPSVLIPPPRSRSISTRAPTPPNWGNLTEEDILAKIYSLAHSLAPSVPVPPPAPSEFPFWVPGNGAKYVTTGVTNWVSGFFSGSIWLLYERAMLGRSKVVPASDLLALARRWSAPIKANENRTDTHDVGFIVGDSIGWDARLTGSASAKAIVVNTAKHLAMRYNPIVKCIRSWGSISDTSAFTVIIDNMMNLDLLFYAASLSGNKTLSTIAETHALTTMKNHIRPDGSQWHVLNYDQKTGRVTSKTTAQGWADNSTWTRGQAWGLYGFANAYNWTGKDEFRITAYRMADLFLKRLPTNGVPPWDFDAPLPAPHDTSAAMIAASGMLYLSTLPPYPKNYTTAAKTLIRSTLNLSLAKKATYHYDSKGAFVVDSMNGFDAMLRNATQDNHPGQAPSVKSHDTGLVYADYYLVEAENRLLRMGTP